MPRNQHHVGRLTKDAVVGDSPMRNRVLGTNAITLILRALIFINGRFFDFPGDARDHDIAAELDAGLLNGLGCSDVSRHRALHIERAHAVDPLIVDKCSLALITESAMRLFGPKRGVEMAVKH